jgi:hypothetical protein
MMNGVAASQKMDVIGQQEDDDSNETRKPNNRPTKAPKAPHTRKPHRRGKKSKEPTSAPS